VARPNQILISKEMAEALQTSDFEIMALNSVELKGFNKIQVYEIKPKDSHLILASHESECSQCNQGIMKIDVDENGIYILKCNSCGHVDSTNSNNQNTLKLKKSS
jgi:hypothetical protein